jgi:GxxExxY protein
VERPIAITYKGLVVEGAYRADLVVENKVLVELKAVEQVASIHEAQVLTYLKLTGLRVGLLINFNRPRLQSGNHRFVR